MASVRTSKRSRDDWGTPDSVFKPMNKELGFTIDVCADVRNRKLKKFFSASENALGFSWAGERFWMNPPYSQSGQWLKKAAEEAIFGDAAGAALIAARTDTLAWHRWVLMAGGDGGSLRLSYWSHAERAFWWHWDRVTVGLHFWPGRIKFVGAPTGAPFPSALVIWGPRGSRLDHNLRFPTKWDIKC